MDIIESQIHVLPCLQELKTPMAYSAGKEKEQQAGYWNETKMEPLSNMETSDLFDTYWSGTTEPNEKFTKDGLLKIPNFNGYGFTNGKECNNFTCQTKWSMYTQYLVGKFSTTQDKQNIAFLVSHHNRMRDDNLYQGILPLKVNTHKTYDKILKKFTSSKPPSCDSYANCFTLKIRVVPRGNTLITGSDPVCGKECLKPNANYHFDVVFPGYPDKGGFSSDKKIGGGYKYCDELLDNINVDVVADGIDEGIGVLKAKAKAEAEAEAIEPFTIYLVRHGNSMHNKPINAKDQEERFDSSLTPLGIYQAYNVGRQIYEKADEEPEEGTKKDHPFSNANIILCSSFLQRTQLTGLCILKGIQAAPSQISDTKWLKQKTAIMITQVKLLKDAYKKLFEFSSTFRPAKTPNLDTIEEKENGEFEGGGVPNLINLLFETQSVITQITKIINENDVTKDYSTLFQTVSGSIDKVLNLIVEYEKSTNVALEPLLIQLKDPLIQINNILAAEEAVTVPASPLVTASPVLASPLAPAPASPLEPVPVTVPASPLVTASPVLASPLAPAPASPLEPVPVTVPASPLAPVPVTVPASPLAPVPVPVVPTEAATKVTAARSGASPVVPAPASPVVTSGTGTKVTAAGSGTVTVAPVNTPVGSPQGSPRGSPPPPIVTPVNTPVGSPQGSPRGSPPPPIVTAAKVTAIPSSAVPSVAVPPVNTVKAIPSSAPVKAAIPTGSVAAPVESKPAGHKIEFHGKFIPGNETGNKLVGHLTINNVQKPIGDEFAAEASAKAAETQHDNTINTPPVPQDSKINNMFKGVPGLSFQVVKVS